jgi:soluble lytic murein transglycosylase-like protein
MESQRLGIVQELELLARRARVLPLVLLVLLGIGLGAGTLVRGALRLPHDTPVRTASVEPVPRVYLDFLSRRMQRVRAAGNHTADYIQLYQQHVAPVERVLVRRGVPSSTARRVAWPLVEQSNRNGVDPATVLSVLLVESAGKPNATSSVGARGLMQVMPAWAGFWRGCGRNLYDIESNICNGTSILAWYLRRHGGDVRGALLGYNGCVRGTNTPNCRAYPDRVTSLRRQVRRELEAARATARNASE